MQSHNLMRSIRNLQNYLMIFGCALLSACGGGGGGSISNNTEVPIAATLYALSGSITGLAGDGLELANGNQVITIPSGSSSFQFKDLLTAGQSYAVSIKTQPAGLTCSVENAVGTIIGSNITNIVVTCSLNAHAIGGVATGLSVSGLVLSNGYEYLAPTPDSSIYQFQQPIAEGGSYSVKIIRQPETLSCKLDETTASGTMGTTPISSLKITCVPAVFHKITGTYSGLHVGTTLQIYAEDTTALRLNSANITLSSINGLSGSFDLGTSFAENEPYHLMVKDTTTGEVCSIQNGSGVMGTQDINNVTVICSGQGYSVGGSVSGLTGSGLVVSNQYDETKLSIAAGATQFVTPKVYAENGSYNLGISTQPSGQFCTLSTPTNSSQSQTQVYGSVGSNDINDLVINCQEAHSITGTIQGLADNGLSVTTTGFSVSKQNYADRGVNLINFGMVAKGQAYSISIARQPSDLRCVIAQGQQGVMGSADINNVVIQCQGAIPQSTHIAEISRDITVSGTYTVSHTSTYDIYNWFETKVLLDDGVVNIYRDQIDYMPLPGGCYSGIGLCGSFTDRYLTLSPYANQVKAMSGYSVTGGRLLGTDGYIYQVGDNTSSRVTGLSNITKLAYRGGSTLALNNNGVLTGFYTGCDDVTSTGCLSNIVDMYIAGSQPNTRSDEYVTNFAINNLGQVYGWGLGGGVMGEGQVGMPEPSRDLPHLISTLSNVKQMSSFHNIRPFSNGSFTNMFALRHDGLVYRWWADFAFELPSWMGWVSIATNADLKPTLIPGLSNVKEISDRHALLNDGTVIVDMSDLSKTVNGLPPIKHLSSEYLIDFTGRVFKMPYDSTTQTYYLVEVTHP